MENKELMLTNNIDFSSKQVVATLKATVAQGLNDAEFMLFAEHCKSTGLNPFKREVWAIKAGGRLQLMTGINGYWTTANRHDQFDGYEEGYISKDGQELPDTYSGNDYVGAWCKVYRKDRKIPAKAAVFLNEYDKGHGNWKTMRRVMIMKCAESVALRKAFPQELNGTYTAEEMPVEYDVKVTESAPIVTADELPKPDVWDGEELVTGGKWKGLKWSQLDPNYLEWCRHNASKQTQEMAEKEISRREAAQSETFDDINEEAEQAGVMS